jgi:hypothetical protein
VRDPLKGWTRKDAALADPFSIEQATVDRAGLGLEVGQVVQATLAAQVISIRDVTTSAQHPRSSAREASPSGRMCDQGWDASARARACSTRVMSV